MLFDFNVFLNVRDLLSTIKFLDIIDIIIVATICYKFYRIIANTRALTLVKGLAIIIVVTGICSILNLHSVTWLLQKISEWLFIALPIIFQPELRRTLEKLGQGQFIHKNSIKTNEIDTNVIVGELVKTTKKLSQTKTGALIVLERKTKLNDIIITGIKIDGIISHEFLLNVFIENTPLHDGAVVIRGNRLISAACVLPLTDRDDLSTELGTRHRAAIGLSEQCDALVIVVSEETGIISIAEGGNLLRRLDEQTLSKKIRPVFDVQNNNFFSNVLTKWKIVK